ncbi:hypothetical protein [Sphaerisporangium corydalis]|uniref:Uncharacterized protein n=1 Tax=Sphaerisporangium corydalis TaxID=1441875 RepID=A0ABV9ES95_9ACTN|nr:hypothetical protein [Sphaerisporangium corydalis]
MSTTHEHHGGHGHGETFAVHGMLLVVGDDRFYFSHLPMFAMVAHRFQVLVEVGFGDDVRAAVRADARATGEDLYTFAPLPFPLVELDPAGGGPVRTSLVGTIFHGHFERGGTPIAEDVTARVRRVAHYRPLDPRARHDDTGRLTYLCFGGAGDLFLAHQITARPDFDQVVRVRMVPEGGGDLPAGDFDLAAPVAFGRPDVPGARLTAGGTETGFFFQTVSHTGAHGFRVPLRIEREIYMETGDLV